MATAYSTFGIGTSMNDPEPYAELAKEIFVALIAANQGVVPLSNSAKDAFEAAEAFGEERIRRRELYRQQPPRLKA